MFSHDVLDFWLLATIYSKYGNDAMLQCYNAIIVMHECMNEGMHEGMKE